MKNIIKSIHFPDRDPSSLSASERYCYDAWVQVDVGPNNSDVSELFELRICTVGWIASVVHQKMYFTGRMFAAVNTFETECIRISLQNLIDDIQSGTWDEFVEKFSKIALHEFADYAS